MSKILCTFPGRTGDILWALPTVRAISNHYGVPVDFMVSKKYGNESLLRLIEAQPYIDTAIVNTSWEVEEGAPMTPRVPTWIPQMSENTVIVNLGYDGWPKDELAKAIHSIARARIINLPTELSMEPWITNFPGLSYLHSNRNIFCGFSHEYMECKMGVALAVAAGIQKGWQLDIVYRKGDRHEEWLESTKLVNFLPTDLWQAAELMSRSVFYFGCLSALWVLANAMGKPCVVVEPAEARLHPIFWRKDDKNVMVYGGGRPTFDARHATDEVNKMIERMK